MEDNKKKSLVSYDMVTAGFEAIYTGKKAPSQGERIDIITTLTSDEAGNEIRKWPVVPWTWPGKEGDWDEEIKYINNMQGKLGVLDSSHRQIRAHIASLVPCDSGLPVTVDELLNAIGQGKLGEPSFRNGCWCSGMWWEQKTTQPFHMKSMRTIYTILKGYLAGKGREVFIKKFSGGESFINRTYEWLGPVEGLTEVQKLMMKRMFLTIDFFTKSSDAVSSFQFSDVSRRQEAELLVKDIFQEGGRGADLDVKISKKADLPPIYPRWSPEFKKSLARLDQPQKKELYKTCCAIASGVYTLSDCHHNTFRYIESWIHGIGSGVLNIPNRKSGTEKQRIGQMLFGYVLGLDKWLLGLPMQFLLLDHEHLNLGFNPKNEIIRVYSYLGEEKTSVKEWLAACLWHNLTYCPLGGNPGGLIRHKNLLNRAAKAGVSLRGWMDSVLRNGR